MLMIFYIHRKTNTKTAFKLELHVKKVFVSFFNKNFIFPDQINIFFEVKNFS